MKVAIHPHSPYAPIRYEATRPYARQLGRLFVAHAKQGESVRIRFIQKDLFTQVRAAVGKLGRPDGPGPVQSEMVNVQVFGKFNAGGRIIFDVARPLVQSLLVTDAADIPCSELVFPASSFYLHFGRDTGLTSDGYEIEGAFIEHYDEALHIDLVPAYFGQSWFFTLPMGEELIGTRVDISQPTRTVLSALDQSVSEIVERNRAYLAQMAEMETQIAKQYGAVVKVPSMQERMDEKVPLLRSALQLIVNTLFFLTAAPEDIQEGWSLDAPVSLKAFANDKTIKPGTQKTAENSLKNLGYDKVQYVGLHYGASSSAADVGAAVSTGRVLSTHIRRGHFRRQPYGPGRELRKTIFVAPVVVNADRAGDSPGRIYEA